MSMLHLLACAFIFAWSLGGVANGTRLSPSDEREETRQEVDEHPLVNRVLDANQSEAYPIIHGDDDNMDFPLPPSTSVVWVVVDSGRRREVQLRGGIGCSEVYHSSTLSRGSVIVVGVHRTILLPNSTQVTVCDHELEVFLINNVTVNVRSHDDCVLPSGALVRSGRAVNVFDDAVQASVTDFVLPSGTTLRRQCFSPSGGDPMCRSEDDVDNSQDYIEVTPVPQNVDADSTYQSQMHNALQPVAYDQDEDGKNLHIFPDTRLDDEFAGSSSTFDGLHLVPTFNRGPNHIFINMLSTSW